jgi:N utilization substance protein A
LKNDFAVAVAQISAERHLPKEVILEDIEQALILAYKRNFGAAQNVDVQIDPNTGKARVYVQKEVVEEVKDNRTQIGLAEARKIDPDALVNGSVQIEMTPRNFGRIAAQTAKQVFLQRIREAERESMYADWSDRLGEVVMGRVRNIDTSGNVILSLGRAEAVMPRSEQIPTEQYSPGQRLRTYIYEVEKTNRGPRIRVSRTHRKLLYRLLESEVPEVFNGVVEIKAIAREPGSRSKVAVASNQEGVDPVGSCVGMRGVRIQNIVNELSGEKTDIVAWAPDESQFIANALSPAKVEHVWLDPDTRTATVVVPDNQLSLAIGKEGQNARLAAKLTNWRIDIKSLTEAADEAERRKKEAAEAAEREAELAAKRRAAAELLAAAERTLAEEEGQEAVAAAEAEASGAEWPAEELGEAEAVADEKPSPEEPAEVVVGEPGGEMMPVEAPSEPEPVAQQAEAEIVEPQPELEPALATESPVGEATPEVASETAVSEALELQAETAVLEDEDEEFDEEERYASRKQRKKRRTHDLVYDEQAGEVVSRKRRKSSRRQPEWEDYVD